MPKNTSMILFGLLIVLLFAFTQVMVVLREGNTAVITTFGKPVRALTQAGLYPRWPWPIQTVHTFDNRTRVLQGSYEETLTRDGKNILVSIYSGWRIADPILFLERIGGIEQAEINLDGLLRTYKNAAIGQTAFSNLVNTLPDALQLEAIEQTILESARPQALERYGIHLDFTGIRRLGLPASITQSVFDRMRAERQELADRYRSEGEGEAIRIRAHAESERDRILSQAEAEAQQLRAQGDAAAAQYYHAFAEDPDLAIFLKKLDVFRQTLADRATVILSSEMPPFDLLRQPAPDTP